MSFQSSSVIYSTVLNAPQEVSGHRSALTLEVESSKQNDSRLADKRIPTPIDMMNIVTIIRTGISVNYIKLLLLIYGDE